jgi:hypothetical protein
VLLEFSSSYQACLLACHAVLYWLLQALLLLQHSVDVSQQRSMRVFVSDM